MRRRDLDALPHALLVTLALAFPLAACGGRVECAGGACAGTGTGAGGASPYGNATDGAPASCAFDPPGAAFTFHVHNAGAATYQITLGCGATIPIDLVTPEGLRSIGPGEADPCEYSCDAVFAGKPDPGCSDCGPGTSKPLAPGMTVDIPWDHRVYTAYVVDPFCIGGSTQGACALGKTVAPSPVQEGVLTACASPDPGGTCSSDAQTPFKFTVDTTGNEATIVIK